MRTEVKTLIAALTTERNSLDRAITALKQMSDVREAEPVRPAQTTRPKAKARKRSRMAWVVPDETRRVIVARMLLAKAAGESLKGTARELARETGVSWATIATGWTRWSDAYQLGGNGHATIPNVPVTDFRETTDQVLTGVL